MPEETTASIQPTVSDRYPEFSPEPVDKRPLFIGITVALVFLLLTIGGGIWLFLNPIAAAILRDIFLIYLGFGAVFVILLLIMLVVMTAYLVIKVNDLVQLLDREIKPLLVKIQETAGTVRGTTTFISDQAVQPVIKTASSVAAIRTILRSLFTRD